VDEAFDAAPVGRGDFTERAAAALIIAAAQFVALTVVALLVVEVRTGWLRRWTVANAAHPGLLAVSVHIPFWGPSTETTSGLVTQVGAQKVIVYSSLVNLGRQAVGLRLAARGSAGAA
jgi:hypothetical protein